MRTECNPSVENVKTKSQKVDAEVDEGTQGNLLKETSKILAIGKISVG